MYNIANNLRIDYLGEETKIILPNPRNHPQAVAAFEDMLYAMALGFQRDEIAGGWRGRIEPAYRYVVAGLSDDQRKSLVNFILDNTGETDIYVSITSLEAKGYSRVRETGDEVAPRSWRNFVEGQAAAASRPKLHGTRDTDDRDYLASTSRPKLHGTRDTGWPHK